MSDDKPNLKHIQEIHDQSIRWGAMADSVDLIKFVDVHCEGEKNPWPGELYGIMNEEIREGIRAAFIKKRDDNAAWVKAQMKAVVDYFNEQLNDES